jgi:malate synthase
VSWLITRSLWIHHSNFALLDGLNETLLREAAQRPSVRDFWETRAMPMFAQFRASLGVLRPDLVVDGSRAIDHELAKVIDWLSERA